MQHRLCCIALWRVHVPRSENHVRATAGFDDKTDLAWGKITSNREHHLCSL
jgi:hypothetical protein